MTSNVAVITGEALGAYGFPDDHPFGPDRLAAFLREFEAHGLRERVMELPTREATFEELRSFHTPAYLQKVREASGTGQGYLDHGDTPAFVGVFEAAARVVGSSLNAFQAILEGRCRRAFVPIAGLHHARPEGAAGFCVFNDCGVVIRQAFQAGLRQVAYVDIDAHHGDGVFYAFEEDARVIFADLHEDGRFLYPGSGAAHETGRGAATGTKLNVPLPPGADAAAFDEHWGRALAHVSRFEPELILLQCGADSVEGDPLTHLRLSPDCHGKAAKDLCILAERLGHGRVLAMGGGGYNRGNIGRAWTAVVEGLLSVPSP